MSLSLSLSNSVRKSPYSARQTGAMDMPPHNMHLLLQPHQVSCNTGCFSSRSIYRTAIEHFQMPLHISGRSARSSLLERWTPSPQLHRQPHQLLPNSTPGRSRATAFCRIPPPKNDSSLLQQQLRPCTMTPPIPSAKIARSRECEIGYKRFNH